VMLEGEGEDDPVQQACTGYLSNIRSFLKRLARDAGIRNPDDFARKWHILMKGSIVSAGEGDRNAARRGKDVAGLLLAQALADAR
jgi:hypothetical protein